MVSRFRRTLSSPIANPGRPSPQQKPWHVRSVSLPCGRSHPLISQLRDKTQDLRSWTSRSGYRTFAWLCDGLVRLKSLHDSVEDLLRRPQTRDSLRRRSDLVEKLLEDFLCFVDVYASFRSTLVGLREEQLTAQMAVRRRDESNVSLYVKARKMMDKEMMKLTSAVRSVGRWSVRELVPVSDGDEELAGFLRDVNEVTVSVTICLFSAMSSDSCKNRKGWNLLKKSKKRSEKGMQEIVEVEEFQRMCGSRKRGEEEVRWLLGRMEGLENCIVAVESEIERVFKSLICTRVALLNILTQNSC